ncbi:hypothetical protein HR060_10465 [Catenovulum sp. SM1970]|uniref:hypothetical protein n=1 Tax=Marinifaba aquimaris TaxID=2741323 RepID=UPI0015736276|nr:hypothetical protein [Marinifaba aquimaris]NTS77287.1 hypothetical protein [Marinifaba aquimaris]
MKLCNLAILGTLFATMYSHASTEPSTKRVDSGLFNTDRVTYLCIDCNSSSDFSEQAQKLAERRKSGEFALIDQDDDYMVTFEVEFMTTQYKNKTRSTYLVKPLDTQQKPSFVTATNY